MKRVISLLLVSILLILLCGCSNGKKQVSDISADTSSVKELSEEEKYNNAVTYIESKNYNEAIVLLKEIKGFKDSEVVLKKCAYTYAIELFNNKNFFDASEYFSICEDYKNAKSYYEDSLMYQGYEYVNSQEFVKGIRLLEELLDVERLSTDVLSNLIKISANLFGGCWKGTITYNRETLYAEIYYSDSTKKFQPVIRRYSDDGPILMQETYSCVLTHREGVFGNSGIDSFDYRFIDDNTLVLSDHQILSGTFRRSGKAYIYKIDYTAPMLSEEPILDNTMGNDENTESKKESIENNSKSPSQNSSSSQSNTSSTTSHHTKPNNTTSTVSQDEKTYTSSTEQHVHDFSINATCEEPAKCSCGETSGLAIGHNWESATCEKPDTCKNCGKTRGSALGHDWEEATCEEAKTCKNCGKKEGKAWGHTYNSTEILICKRCRELNPEGETIISKLSVVNNSDLFTLDSFSISNYGKQSHIYDLGYKFDMDFKITLNESIMRDQVTIIAYDENGNELYESGFGFLPSSSGLKGDTISKQARFHIDGYKPVAKVVIK